MTATTLDPRTALILVDLQKGIAGLPTAPLPADGVIANGARLAAAFRKADLPVVLVNVAGGAPGRTEQSRGAASHQPPADWADLVPELDQQPSDITVTKQQWGAFYGTGIDLELRRRGITQVVVAGIATSIGVESTARAAHEHGYHVTVATDAVTDLDAETHRVSVEKILPRLGETDTTDAIIALLG
ncbi:isochorismatase family protein [Streptomyces sp. SL13]|uniref:Isochorismatase family protein n=1 Tax=Streptantibioticus silvisoli TaxID=2705255 RepID=A0AA90HC55_9ACTN|nr:isochorismatase family protein [Streptantibioticus silvisoli]MDI5967383.1 isochorismatase family protein [Streptantibioticus silvisoli]MDI5973939.1 isochorismatase family protein [Streptantibioticus silvisoli]